MHNLGQGRQAIRDTHTPPHGPHRPAGEDRQPSRRPGATHPLTTHQRYLLHALLIVLFVVAAGMAFGGEFTGSDAAGLSPYTSEPATPDGAGYLQPPVVLATLPGISPKQQADATVEPTPTPTPAPEPTPTPTPEPTPEPQPAYFTYTIQPGDSIASIAAAFGISPDYIFWNNPEVGNDPDFVIAGQELLIPSVDGIIYRVKLGDTLSDIAAFYKISVQDIIAFGPNGLASADSVIEGITLVLPGAMPPPPPPPPPTPAPAPAPEPEPAPPALSSAYYWPFQGPITSYFGEPRGEGVYHQGIDIEGIGQEGAPVAAAAAGQVILADVHPGYGNYVIIRHADGSETLYAHLSGIYVGYGQFVAQGETIGGIGHSGYVVGIDGNHLHFELRIDGIPVDPLPYLP